MIMIIGALFIIGLCILGYGAIQWYKVYLDDED